MHLTPDASPVPTGTPQNTTPQNTTPQSEPPNKVRLTFLDGVRGILAILVTTFHLVSVVPHEKGQLPDWAIWMSSLTFTVGIRVAAFIVMSGYVLMIPVVRSTTGELRGGLSDFFKRRALRILPPYYASFLIALPIDIAYKVTHGIPAVSWSSILAHALLIQNWRIDWFFDINLPIWTVAIEWQIYFVFALLLLPLYRLAGIIPVVLLAAALGCLPVVAFPKSSYFAWDYIRPWYLSLFALGMAGALINFSPKPLYRRIAQSPFWPLLALFGAGALLCTILFLKFTQIQADLMMGVTMTALIIYCADCVMRGKAGSAGAWIAKILEWKPLVALAEFSYSLYLLHFPLLSLFDAIFRRVVTENPMALLVFQFVFVFPAILVISYGFYRIFEKPYTDLRRSESAKRSIES